MKLVIAEKPSVAISIAKVLGAVKKSDGFMEGNGYIVSWCVGHLVKLSNPDCYDEKYKKWKIEDLPIIPDNFRYEVNSYTKKQYGILKKLLNDSRVTETVNACDAGREGELIFRLVYSQAKCSKPVKRLWISSMEDTAIREGFNNLKDGKEMESLYESALARQWADWLVGINASRLYSKKYNKNYSVGRVQTPTLALITEREKEIKNFVKKKYFIVRIDTDKALFRSEKIEESEKADALIQCIRDSIEVKEVKKETKIKRPELPFDLTTLQREANRIFGFSAKQTLDYAQSLYEKKIITYPRTDSRYLTNDMKESAVALIEALDSSLIYEKNNLNRIFNSKKVTDHHAIIPTKTGIEYFRDNTESDSEKRLFILICWKFLSSVSQNYVSEITKITSYVNDVKFTASGKTVIQKGFTELAESEKFNVLRKNNEEDAVLPEINEGDILTVINKKTEDKYTSPPKAFTEDTLLKAMENAGTDEIDKDIDVERKGLGTPATRAGILENLISKKLIKRDKNNLLPTQEGINLIEVVPDKLKSAKLTAQWEMKLYDISIGKLKKDDFMHEIEDEIHKLVSENA